MILRKNKDKDKNQFFEKIIDVFQTLPIKQKRMIILLLFVIMLFITWELSFSFFIVHGQKIRTENEALRLEVDDNHRAVKEENEIKQEIKNLDTETKQILDTYSAGNTPEKTLVFLEKLSKECDMSIPSISFGDETLVSAGADAAKTEEAQNDDTFKGEVGSSINIMDGSSDLYLYNYPVTFSYAVSYEGLKTALAMIAKNPERMTVENISAAYDGATGYISGSITLNQYTLTGANTDRKYKPPKIESKGNGVNNLFG